MRHHLAAAALACALAPTLSHAAYGIEHITATCSAALTVSQSDDLSFQCQGDLSLTGDGSGKDFSRVFAEHTLTLSATGRLDLDHLTLSAPDILLQAGTSMFVGQDVVFFSSPGTAQPAPTVRLTAGDITIRPPLTQSASGVYVQGASSGTLTWQAAPGNVPEPSIGWLALVGLGSVMLHRRRA